MSLLKDGQKAADTVPTTPGDTGQIRLSLEQVARLPGKRALAWHDNTLYASERYQLLRCDTQQDPWTWQPVARYEPGLVRQWGSLHRITSRLLRAGFHALEILESGRIIGVVAGAIVVADPGEAEFRTTFSVRRGTRPLALAVTPQGHVYWGEYFGNPDREEVHIYGSQDQGETWQVVYTFPKGGVKHVHSVTWDPFGECMWVLTGDYGDECKILRATPNWQNVNTVMAGDQQARTATCVPTAGGLYFATDTPLAQNYIYRLDHSGRLERLQPLLGSSLQSCKVGDNLFFSTAVEPSKVNNSPYSTLVGSSDGQDWTEVIRWRKDSLHAGLFQFGNIFLPTGPNETNLLAATGMAVKGHDMATNMWRIMREDEES